MKVRDLIKKIEADGWKYDHTNGGHRIWKKEGAVYIVTISGHDGDEVKPGTLAQYRRITGLKL